MFEFVINREGKQVPAKFDRILDRINEQSVGLRVSASDVALETIKNLYNDISTKKIDEIAASVANQRQAIHPDYGILAVRLATSNLLRSAKHNKFSEFIQAHAAAYNADAVAFIMQNAKLLDSFIDFGRDNLLSYVGFTTMMHTYSTFPEELPQFIYMRVAVEFSYRENNVEYTHKVYDACSQNHIVFGTPTYMNALRVKGGQLQSCFLLGMEDSIKGIVESWRDIGLIGASRGGIAIHLSEVRSEGTPVGAGDEVASGIMPILRTIDTIPRNFMGGDKRPSTIVAYLDAFHPQILDFLASRRPTVSTLHHLMLGIMIPDLIYNRIMRDEAISLFDPHLTPHLSSVYDGMLVCEKCSRTSFADLPKSSLSEHQVIYYKDGFATKNEEDLLGREPRCSCCKFVPKAVFSELYTHYEACKMQIKTIPAKTLTSAIYTLQREAGIPYVLLKDQINRMRSNPSGVVKSGNLCTEIVLESEPTSTACCTLGSLPLCTFIDADTGRFSFGMMQKSVRLLAECLYISVMNNKYPTEKCIAHMFDFRPIGIGVQGLSRLFLRLGIDFDSDEALKLSSAIFEHIYYYALEASCDLVAKYGKYVGFDYSPAARGQLHFDLWDANQQWNKTQNGSIATVVRHKSIPDSQWMQLKQRIVAQGLVGTYVVTVMPTVTSSRIFRDSSESIEPLAGLVINSKTAVGSFINICDLLVKDLAAIGLWNDEMRKTILQTDSIQKLSIIPADLRRKYRTVWEYSQKKLMEMHAARSAYIDLSSSFNVHFPIASSDKLEAILLWAYMIGAKTGSYYIRSKPAVNPINILHGESQAECLSCQA